MWTDGLVGCLSVSPERGSCLLADKVNTAPSCTGQQHYYIDWIEDIEFTRYMDTFNLSSVVYVYVFRPEKKKHPNHVVRWIQTCMNI